jgi:hypothetical protein
MSVLRTRSPARGNISARSCAALVRGLLAAAVAFTFAACDPEVIVGHARETGRDAAQDSGQDAGREPRDAGHDAGPSHPRDAGRDAGIDAAMDAGLDAGPDAAEPVDSGTPLIGPRSQLQWSSGAHTGSDVDAQVAFEAWRGRPMDLTMYFVDRTTGWSGLVTPGWPIDMLAPLKMRLVLSIPLFPEGMGSLAECAAGMYDSEWAKLGPFLKDRGRGDSIIRLGWGPNDSEHYWRALENSPDDYVRCFQRAAKQIKDSGASLSIAWDFDDSAFPGSTALDPYSVYPGDEYVDFIGLEAFDMSPPVYDDASWDAKCHSPTGLCSTLEFARAHGKRLGLSEWAVVSCYGDPGGDNPFYVQKMFELFAANAGMMGFEIYYEDATDVCSSISDDGDRMKAAAEYKALYAK